MIRKPSRICRKDNAHRNITMMTQKPLTELKLHDDVVLRSKEGWDRRGKIVKTDIGPRSYLSGHREEHC